MGCLTNQRSQNIQVATYVTPQQEADQMLVAAGWSVDLDKAFCRL